MRFLSTPCLCSRAFPYDCRAVFGEEHRFLSIEHQYPRLQIVQLSVSLVDHFPHPSRRRVRVRDVSSQRRHEFLEFSFLFCVFLFLFVVVVVFLVFLACTSCGRRKTPIESTFNCPKRMSSDPPNAASTLAAVLANTRSATSTGIVAVRRNRSRRRSWWTLLLPSSSSSFIERERKEYGDEMSRVKSSQLSRWKFEKFPLTTFLLLFYFATNMSKKRGGREERNDDGRGPKK